MKQMKPASAKALTWFAAILLLVGMTTSAHSGAFFCFAAAALSAAFPAGFGAGRTRMAAALLLLAAIVLGVGKYPDFKDEQDRLRSHVTKSSLEESNIEPDYTEAHYALGHVYVRLKDKDSATVECWSLERVGRQFADKLHKEMVE